MRDTKTVEQSYLTDDQTGDGVGRIAVGTLVGLLTTGITQCQYLVEQLSCKIVKKRA